MARFVFLLALALGLGLGLGLPKAEQRPTLNKGPNVIVIMTDDQDQLLDSMSVMPNVRSLIGAEGVTYDKHYCTVAWCCPSRVNFFTGRAAHNTNVTSSDAPHGGWPKFNNVGLNSNYLPVWLQDEGINTYFIGKLMNGFTKGNLADPAPPQGWTDSSFLVDPWTYNYYNSHWTNRANAQSEADIASEQGTHTTDVTGRKALDMLDDAAARKGQFFMMVAPVAPHNQIGGGSTAPPIPEKYFNTFNDRRAPRSENFNPDEPSGASWVHDLPKLTDKEIQRLDEIHIGRLGNIAAIDDMVGSLVDRLDDLGILDNTYIIYTTDNGFHIGQHRLKDGKRCPYEEDINIPLLVRGPDVARGVTSSVVNSHTDMAPTILRMLGVPLRDEFDGASIAYTADEVAGPTKKHELVNVEFWTSTSGINSMSSGTYYNNTYKALRLISDDHSFLYTAWCTGEHEFYDMTTDPGQMFNRLATPPRGSASRYYGRSEEELFDRLDALLMVTKSCTRDSCRDPWATLFPGGEIGGLEDAMRSEYDSFFSNQPKISFSGCVKQHVIAEEGPQGVNIFGASRQAVI
ncbi:hypothetical protein LTR37_012269 [Vermiconidia calcicola]|uniref:Uncharacterized protein n=1 Tax=Vermiconidia calcicola TaxID=1690605 RepID=A0ACC3N176_9PEZI|nr:hypothetical protein LTR37_012269 [Vermiconidia calcicola]